MPVGIKELYCDVRGKKGNLGMQEYWGVGILSLRSLKNPMSFEKIGQESPWNNWLIESLPTLVLRLRISSAKVKKVEYLRLARVSYL